MAKEPAWEVVIVSGLLIDNVSELQGHANGSLSLWLNGRRFWGSGDPNIYTEPDLVLGPTAWLAYRPIPSTQEP